MKYIPSLIWLIGGVGCTIFVCFVLFGIAFVSRDEMHGSHIGVWSQAIGIAIYVLLPVGNLGSLFMSLCKLRGVIDVPDTDNVEGAKR